MILTLWIFIHDLSPFSLEWFKPKYSNFVDLWLWTWWKLLNSIFPIWKFQNLMKFGRDRRLNYRVYLDITLYLIYYYDLNLKESIKSTLLVSICGISTRLRMIAGPGKYSKEAITRRKLWSRDSLALFSNSKLFQYAFLIQIRSKTGQKVHILRVWR